MNEVAKLKVLVVDDEAPARDKVIRLLADDPRFELAGEAKDGVEALERIEQLGPDVLVLDIQMPGLSGFEVLEALENRTAISVVFSTAYEVHALRAFDAHAVDYLLKPFTSERFASAMNKACQQRRGVSADLSSVIASGIAPTRTRLALKTADGPWITLDVKDLQRVFAVNKHTCLATHDAEHLVRRSLAQVASQLDARFVQVHRSAYVNLEAVREVHPRTHGEALLVLLDGASLMLTRTFRDAFYARYRQRFRA